MCSSPAFWGECERACPIGPSERVLDAAMDSASDAGSDASVDMVAGDGSDVEKSVKDTAKKKRPQWDGKKHRHKTWLWRYLGYADATGNGPRARRGWSYAHTSIKDCTVGPRGTTIIRPRRR